MQKHLEILKHLQEIYGSDKTEDDILAYAQKNSVKTEAWRIAFDKYNLQDVIQVIDEYYAKKNSKTKPGIAQITSMLNSKGISPDTIQEAKEAPRPDYDIYYQKLDKENGDMNWLVPHYTLVWNMIKQDKFPFVQNIHKPTHEEFRECMKRWCNQTHGRWYFCLSDNQLKELTPEQREANLRKCLEIIHNSALGKFLNV